MLKRALLILLIMAMALTACGDSNSDDKQDEKTYTVGVINVSAGLGSVYTSFQNALVETGYSEEQITYVYAGPTAPGEALDQAIADIMAQDVDLILSITTAATRTLLATEGIDEVPVLFVPISREVLLSLVGDLGSERGNLTGVMLGPSEEKRLEWLTQIDPSIEQVYIPHNADDSNVLNNLSLVLEMESTFGIEIVTDPMTSEDDVSAAIQSIPEDVDAIFILQDTLVFNQHMAWNEAAIAQKIPISYSNMTGVQNGGLMMYGVQFGELGKQAARLADQILNGTVQASELPVEVAEAYLVINLITADAIELEIPNSVLRQAFDLIRAE